MKKKVIAAIGGCIVIVSIAATFVALDLSKDKSSQTKDVAPEINVPKSLNSAPKVKNVELIEAFPIYMLKDKFVYVESEKALSNKIWIAGDIGAVEANFVLEVTVTDKVCGQSVDRHLKKYELTSEFSKTPFLAFERSDIKLENNTGNLTEHEFPEELTEWTKDVFHETIHSNHNDTSEIDSIKSCKYESNGDDLELITCKDKKLYLYHRLPIGSPYFNPIDTPFAFLYIANRKYLMSIIGRHGEERISVTSGRESDSVEVKYQDFTSVCARSEDE